MRKKLLLITAMLSVLAVVGFKSVSASTNCDRWLQQYKEQLANYTPVKHVRRHVRSLLQRTTRKPHLLNAYIPIPMHRYVQPKLSPEEMMRRFHIVCGDLPPDETSFTPALLVLPPFGPPPFTELTSTDVPPSAISPPIADITPAGDSPHLPNDGPNGPPGSFLPPGSFVPSGPSIPSGFSGSSGSAGSTGPIAPISPVLPPVPEPASLILLLTGLAGVVAVSSRK
jgi:hypothetical protein